MTGAYPVPVWLPRRRRIISPAEWLRDRQRERDQAITKAIAFDADLGLDATDEYALTTTATAAAATRIIYELAWYDDTKTVTGATDNGPGLTWVVDQQRKNANNGNRAALLSAYAPSGLDSGRTITPTFSGGGAPAFPHYCAASSWTGLKDASYLEDADVDPDNFGDTWAINSMTATDDALVFAFAFKYVFGDATGHTAAGTYTELHQGILGTDKIFASVYRIVDTTGGYTPGGTFTYGAGGGDGDLEAVGAVYDMETAGPAETSKPLVPDFARRAFAHVPTTRNAWWPQ